LKRICQHYTKSTRRRAYGAMAKRILFWTVTQFKKYFAKMNNEERLSKNVDKFDFFFNFRGV
jgi:hypothetical protein